MTAGQGRSADSTADRARSDVLRSASAIGQGLAPARAGRAIEAGEVIHVVGAAGAGASAAALLASAAGAHVSGCDPAAPSPYSAALEARSIPVSGSHDIAHVAGGPGPRPTRLAVTKALTSVRPDHPELEAARRAGIALEPWQQVVADAAVNQGGRLVAVAGTHGKSTSAGWLVHVLEAAGRDPAAFVGALLPERLTGSPAATARWGEGDVFVVEADEYAGNFDPFRPSLALVLNVDWDHPDVFPDRRAVVDAFEAWLRGPGERDRRVILGVDDRGAAELVERLADWGDRVTRVAGSAGAGSADAGSGVHYVFEGSRLTLAGLPGQGRAECVADLRLAGRHNAANGACVAAASALLGLSGSAIVSGLASFGGVGRRLEVKGEMAGVLVIDDYGHHPAAIRATISAVRERFPGRPVWVAHEPLTYHRAAAMRDELASALATADHVVIADIWAGRDPDTSITSAASLATAVAALRGDEVAAPGSAEATAEYLASRVASGDIVLSMGGGRSYAMADHLIALLSANRAG